MDLNSLFLIFFVFIIFFTILKKNNLLIDNVSYSNHKIIGAGNKSPIIIGGFYINSNLILITLFIILISAIVITLLGLYW